MLVLGSSGADRLHKGFSRSLEKQIIDKRFGQHYIGAHEFVAVGCPSWFLHIKEEAGVYGIAYEKYAVA